MKHERYFEQVAAQAEALRAAAVAVGPDAPVPTCAKWTAHDLVTHLARIQAWVRIALTTAPDADRPAWPPAPENWDDLLAWWDAQRAGMLEDLRTTDPDQPGWTFTQGAGSAAFWVRRQAHETAIHRLDAEHALAGSDLPTAVPTLLFDPEFAADGIDELLTALLPTFVSRRGPVEVAGKVLFHAADAGKLWVAHLRPNEPLEVGPAENSETADDASVVGTADAVYRAVWGRPSTALISGDQRLLDVLAAP